MKFEQCEKAFFLHKYRPNLRDRISTEKQLTFSRGHEVGKLAQLLFENGIDVSEQSKSLDECVRLTRQLIEKNQTVIYEATFVFNEVLVMIDILVKTENGYAAYEVKSSLKISPTYIKDACLQYYVISNYLKLPIEFFLVCLNDKYELQGELNVKTLFKKRNVTQTAIDNLSYFETRSKAALTTLNKSDIPEQKTGMHCFSPYTCDFHGYCWHSVNTSKKTSVFDLSRVGKERLIEWYQSGYVFLEDLPDDLIQDELFIKQKEALLKNEEIIDSVTLQTLFKTINPNSVCALDIEVYAPAIPVYQGKRPFEATPFLITVIDVNEKHTFYFKSFEEENLLAFCEALIELTKPYQHVLVFDASLENRVIEQLKQLTPYTNELKLLQEKLVDMNVVNHNLTYFNPAFKSGTGLKTIAGVLFPQHSFSKLAVQEGLQAMHLYGDLKNTADLFKHEEIKQQLIDYCVNDSRITLLFFFYLYEKVTARR
jgi:hypothetical protein